MISNQVYGQFKGYAFHGIYSIIIIIIIIIIILMIQNPSPEIKATTALLHTLSML